MVLGIRNLIDSSSKEQDDSAKKRKVEKEDHPIPLINLDDEVAYIIVRLSHIDLIIDLFIFLGSGITYK